MVIKRTVLAVLALVLLAVLPSIAMAANITIRGRVEYRDAALPSNATLHVRLENATTNEQITTLTSQGVVGGKTAPFSYTITLDSSRINANARYRVVAEIGNGQQRLYRGVSSPFVVLTTGSTNAPPFRATASFGRIGDTSSGMWMIALAALLALMAGVIAVWRQRRARKLAPQPV